MHVETGETMQCLTKILVKSRHWNTFKHIIHKSHTRYSPHFNQLESKLGLIVTGTVTDVPQTLPHLESGVIIVQVIDQTSM